MFKILNKEELSPSVFSMDIEAPRVAKKCQAGQFIILRVDEEGERIPLTIANFDREKGIINIVFQVIGASTMALAAKEAGLDELNAVLEKNTAICSSADAVAACKVICDFAKDHKKILLKAGIVEGKVVTVDEVKAVAALPPREVLVAKMLGSLNAPISGLVRTLNGTVAKIVYALDAVREQKEKQSA